MVSKYDVIARGSDSSGRVIRQTRMAWQFYDRVNERIGGRLVIVQGAFNSGVSASAGTHDKAGSVDFRTWNLTTALRQEAQRFGRTLMGSMWYRHQGQGFDPHIHNSLLGDGPLTPQAEFQHNEWRAGRNGLASRGPDDFWRPPTLHNYIYLEEDEEMNKEQEALLKRVAKDVENLRTRLDTFATHEKKRWQADREREKKRFRRMITKMGETADEITVLINNTKDDATKKDLRKAKAKILKELADDPDVTEEDNPSEEGLEEAGVE